MIKPVFPCLWFEEKAKEAALFYVSIFEDSKLISENPMAVVFEIRGSKFMALNGGPQDTFSMANSYVVTCVRRPKLTIIGTN